MSVDTIVDNLDIWTSALLTKSSAGRGGKGKRVEAYGIKKLRELILELAVRGKLVPQDPNDEPASVLLEIIRAKKLKMASEGLIKKVKPTLEVAAEERPFELPKGWIWSRLGNLAEVNGGYAFKSANYTEDGTRVVRISDFDEKGFKDDKIVRHLFSDELSSFRLEKNNILMAMTGGTVGKCLHVKTLLEQMVVNQRVATIKIVDGVLTEYINGLMQTDLIQGVIRAAKNSTNDNISMGNILAFLVPLPPLEEQKRIVAKVDELMALCDRLEEEQGESMVAHQTLVETLLDTLTNVDSAQELKVAWARIAEYFDTLFTTEQSIDRLKQTILQLAVMGKLVPQDPNDEPASVLLERIAEEKMRLVEEGKGLDYTIPETWMWQSLENILTFGPTNGFSPKAVEFETPVRSLTLSATTSGRFNGSHYKYIDTEIQPESDLWLRDGDILVQRGNSIEYVGVSAIYRGESHKFIYPDLMMKLRVSPALDVDYVHLAMSHGAARDYLRGLATGTSGSMPKINQKTLKSLPIPIPPVAEQHRIVAKVDELMALCDTLKEKLTNVKSIQTQLADAIVEQAVA